MQPATVVARVIDGFFRRLVGADNDLVRYFLWGILSLLPLAVVLAVVLSILTPKPRPAVFAVVVNPPQGKVAVAGKGASIEGSDAARTIRVAEPDGQAKVTVVATLAGYETLMQEIQPQPGESGRLALKLKATAATGPAPAPARVEWPKERVVDLGSGVKLELLLVSAGSFTMGSPAGEKDRLSENQVRVTIGKGFYLGKTSVTQAQFKAMMRTTPWAGQANVKEGDDYPATWMDWNDAAKFCRKLTARESRSGRLPEGFVYALPTEAQREYACRAGTTGAYAFGSAPGDLGAYAWWGGTVGNGNCKTEQYAHRVGQKKPNPWGLYDMHGNVWEFCRDCYADRLPGGVDPFVETGSLRLCRGGAWDNHAGRCRSSARGNVDPSSRGNFMGFRLALVPAGLGPELPEVTVPLKIRTMSSRTIAAGKPLTVAVFVEDAQRWNGALSFRLDANAPPGTTIDSQTGVCTWTPPLAEPAGPKEISVSIAGPDGQTIQSSFTVTVTRPGPARTPANEIAVDLGNGVNLEMVHVPAGEFLMGSPDSDKDADTWEKPQHRVRISKPFYLGACKVTVGQFRQFVSDTGYKTEGEKDGTGAASFANGNWTRKPEFTWKTPGFSQSEDDPVVCVSWNDATAFCQWLGRKDGRSYALPKEAQWEYACRAGSTTKYCFGDDEALLGEYAWHVGNSDGKTHPVGKKKPNAWGLYDMQGNAWEWCEDGASQVCGRGCG